MKNNPSTDKEAHFFTLLDWVCRQYPDDENIVAGAEFYKKLVSQFGFTAKTEFLECINGLFEGGNFVREGQFQVITRHDWVDKIKEWRKRETKDNLSKISLPESAKSVLRQMSSMQEECGYSRRLWLAGGVAALLAGNGLFCKALFEEHKNRMTIAATTARSTPQQIKELCDKETLYLILAFAGEVTGLVGGFMAGREIFNIEWEKRLVESSPAFKEKLAQVLRGTGKFAHAYFDWLAHYPPKGIAIS